MGIVSLGRVPGPPIGLENPTLGYSLESIGKPNCFGTVELWGALPVAPILSNGRLVVPPVGCVAGTIPGSGIRIGIWLTCGECILSFGNTTPLDPSAGGLGIEVFNGSLGNYLRSRIGIRVFASHCCE